jgi:hypothetical protein
MSMKWTGIAGATLMIGIAAGSEGAVPNLINWQGFLKNNGAPVNGNVAMELRLYNVASGGTLLYADSNTVSVVGGLYSTVIGDNTIAGSLTAALTNTAVYVEQVVNGTVLLPREQLASSAYAIKADSSHTKAVYRWNMFHTYDPSGSWLMGNNPAMFGGVNPAAWTDGNARANQIPSTAKVLRTLFTQKGYGGENATIVADVHDYLSSTDGAVATVLFRIKNTTAGAITWSPSFYFTCYGAFNEWASVARNGVLLWDSAGGSSAAGGSTTTVNISIPAGQTSTVIFVSTAGPTTLVVNPIYRRAVVLAFFNDCLVLPAGLEYVDDLDTITSGW